MSSHSFAPPDEAEQTVRSLLRLNDVVANRVHKLVHAMAIQALHDVCAVRFRRLDMCTVAFQFNHGNGARCASEMEMTGLSANSRNRGTKSCKGYTGSEEGLQERERIARQSVRPQVFCRYLSRGWG